MKCLNSIIYNIIIVVVVIIIIITITYNKAELSFVTCKMKVIIAPIAKSFFGIIGFKLS